MKRNPLLTIGAAALLGTLSTAALAQETEDEGERHEIVVSDSEIVVSDGKGDSRVVRMVVDAPDAPGAPEVCVFVPAGDEAAGAISCPGGNVRVFQFGPGHGRQFIIDDEVVDEEEIREMVEARMEALRERLGERQAWQVEVLERLDSEEYEREMERLEARMEALTDNLDFDFEDPGNLTPEEREEFNREMEHFAEQMARFGEQMAQLQSEAMAEVAATMAHRREMAGPVPPAPPGVDMEWFESVAPRAGRQVIRLNHDGEEHVTIIERRENENGAPQLVIRTTDPESVRIERLDPDEAEDAE